MTLRSTQSVIIGAPLEVFDYLRSSTSGRFMSQVIRKKTSQLGSVTRQSRGTLG